ncbi:hypothetical protein [Bacteroides acidifaciens]|uniref:hypothetical protein n=1 Tax=Bacteroides acidifaciens TaxID=85831 RepID=UPI0025B35CAE|nr:hypothetical protein [Bacteroides acidifaciens]
MNDFFNRLCFGMGKDPNVQVMIDGKTIPLIITNMETDRYSYEPGIKIKLEGVIEQFSSAEKGASNIPSCMMYEKVIFNEPATIVIWKDGSKTVVKCQKGDSYDPEKGLALCFMKKALGNKGNFNNILKSELSSE